MTVAGPSHSRAGSEGFVRERPEIRAPGCDCHRGEDRWAGIRGDKNMIVQ